MTTSTRAKQAAEKAWPSGKRRASARARANFALIKYWGKADARLNVPAVGSISITLDALWSDTDVELDPSLAADELVLDGQRRAEQLDKVSACLDILRERAGVRTRARVVSANNFPTGAGLASSASGFAALVTAAAGALDLDLTPREREHRRAPGLGLGRALGVRGVRRDARGSLRADGSDSFAEPLLAGEAWPLEVVIAVTAKGEKEVGSRSGMTRSAKSSPYYAAWVGTQAGRSRRRTRRDRSPRLRGARGRRGAQLPQDARGRDGVRCRRCSIGTARRSSA